MKQELTGQEADTLLSKCGELADQPAWKAVCERHAEEMRKIEALILNGNTPDEEANALRRSRAVYMELSPEKLLAMNRTRFQHMIDKSGIRNKQG
jgi:endonuclease III